MSALRPVRRSLRLIFERYFAFKQDILHLLHMSNSNYIGDVAHIFISPVTLRSRHVTVDSGQKNAIGFCQSESESEWLASSPIIMITFEGISYSTSRRCKPVAHHKKKLITKRHNCLHSTMFPCGEILATTSAWVAYSHYKCRTIMYKSKLWNYLRYEKMEVGKSLHYHGFILEKS